MIKLTVILLFVLGLTRLHGQTLPISVLPKPAQKMLIDFALVKVLSGKRGGMRLP